MISNEIILLQAWYSQSTFSNTKIYQINCNKNNSFVSLELTH